MFQVKNNELKEIKKFEVLEDEGMRLDAFLSDNLTNISRSYIQKLITEKSVLVNGKAEKKSFSLKEFDKVEISFPEPKPLEILGENIPLDILYEDEDVVVVNKNKGMVVHPAPGNYEHTLVNALLYHVKGQLSEINGYIRPGIVHRIDKDTSGILVIAKNNFAHHFLSEQFKVHSINREYQMIVFGVVKRDEQTIDTQIGRNPKNRLQMAVVPQGKQAITHLHVLERFTNYTYMKAKLETGRTHQIRVHCTYIGHPLLGDFLYSNRKSEYFVQGQTLHAGLLGFIHPSTKKYMEFQCDIPNYFSDILLKERNKLR